MEAKRFEREALERRYGRLVTDARGDLVGLALGTVMFDSESESCGDCSGSSSVGIVIREAWYSAGRRGVSRCVVHRYAYVSRCKIERQLSPC